jgi:uncharacterized protein involved in type VI secretion and phage assembly
MDRQETNGLVIGVVSNLEDPDNLGRVRVRYPHLNGQESQWARLVSPMAGPDRGLFFRPEKDDEVIVAFELGEIRRPYILGSLWSTVDQPPENGEAKKNDLRLFKSRSGHIIRFDDTSGAEKVELIDKDDKHKIIIDCAGDKLQLICDSGNLEISATAGTVKIDAQDVEVTASGSMKLTASGEMTLKGSTINLNP